jgi:hypothetical protein
MPSGLWEEVRWEVKLPFVSPVVVERLVVVVVVVVVTAVMRLEFKIPG